MDIVDRIVALRQGAKLHLSVGDAAREFGGGDAGLTALREIAEDNDCAFSDLIS